MDDYIKREDAKEAVVRAVGKGHSPFNAIVMLPAADVVEVKHGRWINPEDPTCYKCSACGKYRNQQQGYAAPIFDKYCPSCGAKMDGGEDDGKD